MSRQLTRRLILGPIQLLAVAVLVFVLLAVAPGDPAENLARLHTPGSEPPRELVLAIRTELGLDDPAPVRFSRWLLAALQGDLGVSYRTGKPIAHDLLIRLPATVHLAAAALALGLAAAVPLGIAAALGPGSWPDRLGGVVSLAALTVPSYVLALLLVLVFAATLGWLPAFGSGSAAHMVLPSIALGASIIAQLYQLTRASLLEVLHEDYVRTATSKGLHPRTVVLRHAFRNALLPLVTLIATMTGHLLGGAVVVETIFGWPGLGKYAVDAVFLRDYPAVLGAVLYLTAVFVILGAALELVYHRLEPRLQAHA